MTDLLVDVHDMPFADQPHHYAGTTCGDIAEQILQMHPRGTQATDHEVETLVAILAVPRTEQVEYHIGGNVGGWVGGPGTWISIITGPNEQRIFNLSPYCDKVYNINNAPEDPTVLDRVAAELQRIADDFERASGERVLIPRLLRRTKDFFGDNDIIAYKGPGAEDTFRGHFSHIPLPAKHSLAVTKALADAFHQIRLHHRHRDAIKAGVKGNADRARKRFERMGASVGETHLVKVDENSAGAITSVATTTAIQILGDCLVPETVMLNLRNPPRVDPGELDGWKVHARNHKRRLKLLAGRDPVEAITVCPVIFRTIPMLSQTQRVLLKQGLLHVCMMHQSGPEDEELENVVKGLTIKDGHVTGTLAMLRGTWRSRTLQVPNMTLPQTVLTALAGRPFTAVIEDDRLKDFIVERATCDVKGRLKVYAVETTGISLKNVLEECTKPTQTLQIGE